MPNCRTLSILLVSLLFACFGPVICASEAHFPSVVVAEFVVSTGQPEIDQLIQEWKPKVEKWMEEANPIVLIALGIGMALGLILLIAGPIFYIIRGFQQHKGWGITCLLGYLTVIWIPQLLFTVMRWKRARAPFLMTLLGAVLTAAPAIVIGLTAE